MIDGSGSVYVLLVLLGLLERDALERGEPSILDRLAGPLRGLNDGNVVDFSLASESQVPAEWRQDALDILDLAKVLASRGNLGGKRTGE